MAAYISEDKITEIKNRADILDIVSESVLLKKAGRNYVGLCPFHSEKTPSFTVSPDKQIFYCFGCGEGGNVFSFLMKLEGLSFPEAARQLAKRYGIELPSRSLTPAQKQQISEKERLLTINQMTAEFYQRWLMQNDAGISARDYIKKRRLSKDTCRHFGLGYAPDGWEHLVRFLTTQRVPLALAEKAGLVIARKQKQGFYDRFRNRIIFPIHDVGGRVIGFGGRVMDDKLPKYMNSPESMVYNKSKSLYGLHRAKQACRESETVHIVEGYIDLITLHQAGIQNAVATLGTALTEEHIRLMKGFARKAVLVFDSDNAGIRAAHRSVDLFMRFDMDAKVMVLPQGHDPDTFITEYGCDEFLRRAGNASGMMRFLIETAVEKHGLSIEGKTKILKEMQHPLAAIEDGVARSLYAKELAERINVNEAAVFERIRSAAAGGSGQRMPASMQSKDARQVTEDALLSKGIKLERQMIAMMLQFPEIIPDVEAHGLVDLFESGNLQSIGRTLLKHKKQSVSEIISAIEDKDQHSLATRLAIGHNAWDRSGCIKLISQYEMHHLQNRLKQLQKQIKSAGENKNLALETKLLKELQELQKQIKEAGAHKNYALLLKQFETRQMQVTQSQ